MYLRRATSVIVVLLLLAVLQPASYAADVRVTGPSGPIPVNAPAFVNVEGVKLGDPFTLFVVPSGGQFVELYDVQGKPVGIYTNSVPGIYTAVVVAYDAETKTQNKSTFEITVGPGPSPVPPVPTPPPGPDPPPVPVVEGKRSILIVRETADATPDVARMITALRTPPHADYLKSKGHTLAILDDDSVDENGNPSPLVEAWRPHFAGMTLPVVFVIDPAGGKLIHKQSIPSTATADDVMQILKGNGG